MLVLETHWTSGLPAFLSFHGDEVEPEGDAADLARRRAEIMVRDR